MVYTSTTWATGDNVTATKLNNIETALSTFSGQALYVNAAVSGSTVYSTIQAAVDALPSSGGAIYVAPGTYAPFSTSKANVQIIGGGAPGQDEQVGAGAVVINVPSGQHGAQFSVGAGSENFRGPRLRNLYFKGVTGSLSGVRIGRASNFILDDITCANFLDGTGILLEGSNSTQYGEIHSPKIHDCMIGLDVVDVNGVRLYGGSFEYYLGGSPVVTTGTTGIRVAGGTGGADNFRAFGPVIQFYETCIDLVSSESHEIFGGRFEAFTTAVHCAASKSAVWGGSYTNSILGGGTGKAFVTDAASDRFVFLATSLGSLATPVFTDAGTNTHYLLDRVLHLPSAGKLEIGDANIIRIATGQLEAFNSFNVDTHLIVGRANDTNDAGKVFFGSAQSVGLSKKATGVVGISTGSCIRTGTAATGSRPSASTVGQGSQFFDTTLNKPIWSDGTNWRDAAGTVV